MGKLIRQRFHNFPDIARYLKGHIQKVNGLTFYTNELNVTFCK